VEGIKNILEKVRDNSLSVEDALKRIKGYPFEKIDDILFDHHRNIRKGFPEVIYGKGKSAAQLVAVAKRLIELDLPVLITRVGNKRARKVRSEVPALQHDPVARVLFFISEQVEKLPPGGTQGKVVVMTAGTSDLPVAREACVALDVMGIAHEELIDVGVAGIHRLFSFLDMLEKASVIICIAGMEGALPSIVGGLVKCPVIAVPTSTGYGSNMEGLVPLLAMLNTCAPGVGVVNIDNGFGAAALAASIVWTCTTPSYCQRQEQ